METQETKLVLRPAHKRILVKFDPPEERRGQIIVPETAQDNNIKGVILAVADDVFLFKPGDRVVVKRWVGAEVEIEGEICKILFADDILGTLDTPCQP